MRDVTKEGSGTGLRRLIRWRPTRQQEPKLAPISIALAAMLALAFAITTAVTLLGLHFLHVQHFQPQRQLSAATLFNLLKIAFAVAAGIGAVVALVTAYRRQRIAEFADRREGTRLLNERFATAAGQLGHDNPAVRLAGVYAMAGLADDWPQQRQTCVDVLCAYLRMPYEHDGPEEKPLVEQLVLGAAREVRHTVIRVITAHLQPDGLRAPTSAPWHGLDLDFTGVAFDGGDFTDAQFTGGRVNFIRAQFTSGQVNFIRAQFTGGWVDFGDAQFMGGRVDFGDARFTGAYINFRSAQFTSGQVNFGRALFAERQVNFIRAQFTGGQVYFRSAQFTGGQVDFGGAEFTGGLVDFVGSRLADGQVNFSEPNDWSSPPMFPAGLEEPTPGVLILPRQAEEP